MYLSNQWYAEAAADARLRNSKSTVFLDVLTSRLHEHMPYSSARLAAQAKVEQCLKELRGEK